ncbi:uncharacterized protein LOC130689450 [Daphnia carinata]|uniref:uncharacterized protein LOC130689450 n=1 Tax=Daphnia carinata TaxID=120202 RepID=UPI0025796572|nr:uncharacterized protein LOC130689450 [Daphnia carinata]
MDEKDRGFLEDDTGSEEEPDGQLLLEIIRKEEDCDLRQLVKRFRDQCQHHLMDTSNEVEVGWSEQQDRYVIDYLNDPNKVALFVSSSQEESVVHRLRFDWTVVGSIHGANVPTCFFIKIGVAEPLIRPGQFDTAIYNNCLVRGIRDLPRHLTKVVFYFERHALNLSENRLKEMKHLMEGTLLKLRQFLIEGRCLSDSLLLKPTLIVQPPELDDEDHIEQLERLGHQWISVVTYSLELRDYYPTCSAENNHPTIQDEINSLLFKYEILKKLGTKLMKADYQRVLSILKEANSVVGDELENLLDQLQEASKQTKLAARYLTCLRRSVDEIEKVKILPETIRGQHIAPLIDLPAIYQDACNRIIIIVRHVDLPNYENRESDAAARLLFTIGNEVVTKISQHALAVAIDQLFLKGRPRECVEDLEKFCRRTLQRCVATYFQTMKWQKMELNDQIVLANFHALDLRLGHIIDICESLEQLGRYGEGIKPVTFCNERERDIGLSLTIAQDNFVELAIKLVSHHRTSIFDILNPEEWYKAYNSYQNETRALEIHLVHDFEEAVHRCSTLWNIYEVLMSFKHLYRRPLFTAVINSTANQLLKKASREAKVACGISSASDPWSTPINATLTTLSTRLGTSAQRARGYLDKIAKLVQMASWAGSPSYREKALLRCQQAHRLLGEAIKKEHLDWIDKVHVEIAFNMNASLHKFAVRRHFKRPDWIQCNLDGIVFQVVQASESWDRLLLELPGQVTPLWNERNELRNVHGSVCAMCYYYNYIVQELEILDKDLYREALVKLEKAVQPCLISTTWKQLILVKRVVTSVFFAMEEVVQDLVQRFAAT